MQMPESPADVHMLPPEVKVSITSATEEPTEQPEVGPDVLQPLSGQDTPTTTQSVPEEVMNFSLVFSGTIWVESQPAPNTQVACIFVITIALLLSLLCAGYCGDSQNLRVIFQSPGPKDECGKCQEI